MRRPIVLVPACTRQLGAHPYHTVQAKYIDAIVKGADCAPLILPALGESVDLETMLASCDGVMLTGAASNVDPGYYGQAVRNPDLPQDPQRDATTLPLIRAAIKRGIPLLAICRGFQEVNVALGGSLHQAVQDVPGLRDHREDHTAPLDVQYGPAHELTVMRDGVLEDVLGKQSRITVNSLHGQGVDRLASGLFIEAQADDGLVEAFSIVSAPSFALAVQWHPEWRVTEDPVSLKLFRSFGVACRDYLRKRTRVP